MATFMQTDNVYFPANAVALNKNQLLTDKVTMYSGGNDTDGYWIKFSNGIGAFFKKADVTFNTSYNSTSASFYRWVCDGSTNTAVRDNFIPKGIKFRSEPKCWYFASNGISPDGGGSGVVGSTSININGISCDTNNTTYGYVPRTFTLNVNDPTLTSCTIACLMIGAWKISTDTDSSHTFIKPQTTGSEDVKWTSNSVAFNNASTPTTLKDMILKNTIVKFSGDQTTGYVEFNDGLKICWFTQASGTLSKSAGAKGYIANLTPSTSFPCTFSFPPAVFISSCTARHIPMSVYDTSTTKIGKIVFNGTNETGGANMYVLAIGI